MSSGVADIMIVSISGLLINVFQSLVASYNCNLSFNSLILVSLVSAIYNLSTRGLELHALALIPPHHPVPITPTLICLIKIKSP